MTDDAGRAPDGPSPDDATPPLTPPSVPPPPSPPAVPTPPPPTPSAQPPPPRRLLRSRDDRMIAGVCGGLAAYLEVDTVLIRVVAVILALSGGPGVIAYIIGWIAIPEARPGELTAPRVRHGRSHDAELGRYIVGAVLIGLGGLWLLTNIIPGIFMTHALWPLVLIAVGIFIVVQGTRR